MRNLMNATDDEMTAEFAREQCSNAQRVSATLLDENIRLFLQYRADRPSPYLSYPMMLDGVPERAIAAGFFKGVEITELGWSALKRANAELGSKATRYVSNVKYFGSLEPVVYGYPFQWPLSAPVCRIGGSLVADKRNLFRRLFNI